MEAPRDARACAYRLVVNAATAQGDLAWLQEQRAQRHAGVAVDLRADFALVAVQGPEARMQIARAVPALAEAAGRLGVFSATTVGDCFIARTGYTGEDGCELALPAAEAPGLWQALAAAGVRPCGLGARDTLRLEAGMNLYGNDMDETVTPLVSGLGWTVDVKTPREFIGRAALERQRAQSDLPQLLGLKLLGRGVLRAHQLVRCPQGTGELTSGTYAPTLDCSIGLARLPAGVRPGDEVAVELRTGPAPAVVCRPPFVRNGKVLV